MGGVRGGPLQGAGEQPASGWFVSVEKGICLPFSGLSPLHSVHVGLHLSHERCFGKLTVLPWQQQHQHLLMEQPFREWSLIQATTSMNVLLLVLD